MQKKIDFLKVSHWYSPLMNSIWDLSFCKRKFESIRKFGISVFSKAKIIIKRKQSCRVATHLENRGKRKKSGNIRNFRKNSRNYLK